MRVTASLRGGRSGRRHQEHPTQAARVTRFTALDADSDGTINGPELHFGIREMLGDVLSPAQISDIIVALDANEDHRIDLGELKASMSDEE